jgi:hypothetical protein
METKDSPLRKPGTVFLRIIKKMSEITSSGEKKYWMLKEVLDF